ncbi:hypothetical protein LEM8419_01523 [Neolewinella maritima]|uniref:HlyD family efflux transporter periplasmic adaptor subunit n=2 Tax=Neolewinella maritima TaxID=1383882 RepID=A0ABM9B008_9BACT|nr:hypothetical protein LEM8419_01523 [Neolewinella maritima]
MLLLTVLCGGLLLLSGLFYYPSTLHGTLTLTTVDPPRQLPARRDFTIEQVLVQDQEMVQAGQTILVATDARARFEHVLALEDRLLEYRGATPAKLVTLTLSPRLLLGPIQEAVNTFQQQQEIYQNVADRRLEGLTSAELANKIGASEREVRQLRMERSALEDRLAEARMEVEREETLQGEGLRNEARLAAARESVTEAEEQLQEQSAALRSASLSIELMTNQIDAYRSGRQGSSRQAALALSQAFEELQVAVASWKREFTVVSPVTGTVVLQPEIRPKTYLREGQLVATILPADAGQTIGRLTLPVRGSGRLSVGQPVIVAFDRWPALEYGSVMGEVKAIGAVPVDGSINLEVRFPNGLTTTTGGQLEGSPLMQGRASVIVDRRRVIQRLLGSN